MDKMQKAGARKDGTQTGAQDPCVGLNPADFYSCEEAVRRLNEYLDHQLTDVEKVVVMRHLELCRPCLRRFTFEKTLVISLRQKAGHQAVPFALREKLHGLLRAED